MKKKTKIIIELSIYIIILLGILLGVFFYFFKFTRTYDAIIERNGAEKEATITFTYNFWDKCQGNLNGKVLVETKDGESLVEFSLDTSVSVLRDRYSSTGYVWVDEEGWNPKSECHWVSLSFDKELDNIVLYSTEDKYFIYSATEEFLYTFGRIREKCANDSETE